MTLLSEDRSLLDAFRRGDRRALEAVFLHYGAVVHAAIKHGFSFQTGGRWQRFTGCAEHETEELMQEVFRRAFEEKARLAYDGLRPYKAYLLTIARNYVIDELRRARRKLEVLDCEEPAADDEAPPPRTPEQVAADQQLMDLLAAFQRALDETEAGVFRCRFGEELDQEHAAAELGLSVYKVRKLERHLRKRLLVHLKQHGYLAGRAS